MFICVERWTSLLELFAQGVARTTSGCIADVIVILCGKKRKSEFNELSDFKFNKVRSLELLEVHDYFYNNM